MNNPRKNQRFVLTKADLPARCPMPNRALWDYHPKVFIALDKTGKGSCPYCGNEFILKDTA